MKIYSMMNLIHDTRFTLFLNRLQIVCRAFVDSLKRDCRTFGDRFLSDLESNFIAIWRAISPQGQRQTFVLTSQNVQEREEENKNLVFYITKKLPYYLYRYLTNNTKHRYLSIYDSNNIKLTMLIHDISVNKSIYIYLYRYIHIYI